MDGFLLVDKPAGWTSFDVVAKVRNILRQGFSEQLIVDSKDSNSLKTTNYKLKTTSPKVKVGHTGTLDPMATGLLILVLGNYTRKAIEFSALDKSYEAELTLGFVSSTGDGEGEIKRKSNLEPVNDEIGLLLKTFIGTINQQPPAYSAVKVDGQRAYKLARQGKNVTIRPRKVTIYNITDIHYHYPILKFSTSVSSGTYIRALASDIGRELATGAYLSALRRTQVGDFEVEKALPLEEIDYKSIAENLQA